MTHIGFLLPHNTFLLLTTFTITVFLFHMQQKLVGISEIGRNGKCYQAGQFQTGASAIDDFPRPVETLQSGPVWNAEVIQTWLGTKSGPRRL